MDEKTGAKPMGQVIQIDEARIREVPPFDAADVGLDLLQIEGELFDEIEEDLDTQEIKGIFFVVMVELCGQFL